MPNGSTQSDLTTVEPEAPSVRRILVIDDHPMMRLGLKQFVAQEPDLMVCGEARDATSALDEIARTHPDLVVLDISLEGRSGLDLLKDLQIRFPTLPVLIHSMHDEMIFAERTLAAGARGYLMKQETGEELLEALRAVLAGKTYVSKRMRARTPPSAHSGTGTPAQTPIACLSQREFEVFRLIGRGYVNQEVAEQLHISIKTVEAHRENIKRKLNLGSSTALNLLAVRWEST